MVKVEFQTSAGRACINVELQDDGTMTQASFDAVCTMLNVSALQTADGTTVVPSKTVLSKSDSFEVGGPPSGYPTAGEAAPAPDHPSAATPASPPPDVEPLDDTLSPRAPSDVTSAAPLSPALSLSSRPSGGSYRRRRTRITVSKPTAAVPAPAPAPAPALEPTPEPVSTPALAPEHSPAEAEAPPSTTDPTAAPDASNDATASKAAPESYSSKREAREAERGDRRLASTRRGDTALHIACVVGDEREEIVEALTSMPQGVRTINTPAGADGATPLMRCAESGAVRCAKLLIARGADLSMKDFAGKGVMYYALQHAQYTMVDFLLEHGVKRDTRDTRSNMWWKLYERKHLVKAPAAPVALEDTSRVLAEEFGSVDLDEEIAKMKDGASPAASSTVSKKSGGKKRGKKGRKGKR